MQGQQRHLALSSGLEKGRGPAVWAQLCPAQERGAACRLQPFPQVHPTTAWIHRLIQKGGSIMSVSQGSQRKGTNAR